MIYENSMVVDGYSDDYTEEKSPVSKKCSGCEDWFFESDLTTTKTEVGGKKFTEQWCDACLKENEEMGLSIESVGSKV